MDNLATSEAPASAPQAPKTMFPVVDTGSANQVQAAQAPQVQAAPGADSGVPENGGEAAAQQPESAPEFQFELPSGSRYRTTEDLIRGATEKDFAIERYKAEIAQLKAQSSSAPQVQPQTAQDPQAQANDAIAQLQREIEMEYRSDPRFQGYSPDQISEQAYIDARREYRAEQRALAKIQEAEQTRQQEAQAQQWREFERTTPDLQTPLAQHLWEKSVQSGNPYPSPHALLDAVHAEMYRRGIQPSQPQSGGTTAIQGALQNPQRPLFGNAVGTSAPEAPSVPEYVQNAIEAAKQRGVTDPAELKRIQDFAMNVNTTRLNRKVSRF